MTNLVIDIGNTFTKIAIFKLDALLTVEQFEDVDTTRLDKLLKDYKVNRAIVSSVKKKVEPWQTGLGAQVPLINFNNSMSSGIRNHYLTSETLGTDRMAAVIGASHIYPGQNNLVIAGGTCITYDYVDGVVGVVIILVAVYRRV